MPRVLFVDLFTDFYDRHGVYSLSSFMKEHGIEVYFVRESSHKKRLSRIADIKPDLLLYSSFSSSLSSYAKLDKMAKGFFKGKSLIGGPGPTFDWNSIEGTSIDAACIGEGESALVDFIKGGLHSRKNIFCRGEGMPSDFHPLLDLDDLPFPDRGVVYETDPILSQMPSKQFLSGRGCPYQCTYCFNHKFREIFKAYGPAVRKKSVAYLLEEIRLVRKRYPLSTVVFNDDTFILNKKWFLEFSENFPREVGLAYTCNIRADLVDEEIVKALKNSNCVGVNWSIESGNEFLRNEILKHAITTEEILNTSRLLTKYKIPYRIGNLIGLPGEELNQMLETLELNIKARPALGLANIFVPFPGLELTRYAVENGYYKPEVNRELPNDFFTRSVMDIAPAENRMVQKLMCLFPLFVKFPLLYHTTHIRKLIFSLPRFLLRFLYEVYYTLNMMRLYVAKSSPLFRLRMAMRYIMGLIQQDIKK